MLCLMTLNIIWPTLHVFQIEVIFCFYWRTPAIDFSSIRVQLKLSSFFRIFVLAVNCSERLIAWDLKGIWSSFYTNKNILNFRKESVFDKGKEKVHVIPFSSFLNMQATWLWIPRTTLLRRFNKGLVNFFLILFEIFNFSTELMLIDLH